MDVRLPVLAGVILAALSTPDQAAAASGCKLAPLTELPVTMRRSQPTIPATINGTDVRFLVDSGAFYCLMSPAGAAALNLPTQMAPVGVVVRGLGGDLRPGPNAETIDTPGDITTDSRDPVDAQGFSRRGAVFAARCSRRAMIWRGRSPM